MKAAVRHRFGGPQVIAIEDLPRPVPGRGEVLVRVQAASVNSWDWDQLVGTLQGRLGNPFRPVHAVLGADIAGTVESVGPEVTRFTPGDDVFGDISDSGWGGFAEYVRARETDLVARPAGMDFVAAAAIPQAGLLALQGLRLRPPRPGERVLVNGAGGGVGTFAVQMAKAAGAIVTAVDRGDKHDALRALGADHVFDYRSVDYTARPERYHFVLDPVARRRVAAYRAVLEPDGHCVVVGGGSGTILESFIAGAGRVQALMWRTSTEDLEQMKALFAAGTVIPRIDRVYPLEQAAAALRRVGEGNAIGKVIITP